MQTGDKVKKVGLLIPEFPTQTHIAWWRVGKAMRDLGFEVQMLSTRAPAKSKRVHPCLDEEGKRTHYIWPPDFKKVAGCLFRWPLALFRGLGYVLGLRESGLKEKAKRLPLILSAIDLLSYSKERGLDLIFVHSCADAAHVAAMCRLMGGPKYALRLGGDLEVYGKDHRSKMAGASLIVPASRTYIPRIQEEAGVSLEKISWAWVGVDMNKFKPTEQTRESGTPLRLATVSRLTRLKGHMYVLRAIKELKDKGIEIQYTIAGSGDYEQAIRQEIEASGLTDQARLVGPLAEDDVVKLLHETDLFVLASYSVGEGTPAAVCEAMACGVPALCTEIGGTRDMINDGDDGFIVPQEDAHAIAEKIEKLAKDPDLLAAISRTAMERRNRFDVLNTAKMILEKVGLRETNAE